MSSKLRRHDRTALRAPVRVTWHDRSGSPKFALARTLDVSEMGIRVELPEGIELLTPIGVQSERLKVVSSGVVRNCIRCGARYMVGIEFGGKIKLDKSILPDQAFSL